MILQAPPQKIGARFDIERLIAGQSPAQRDGTRQRSARAHIGAAPFARRS